MTTCRLFLKERVLRNSHIVPEFLYSAFYNDKGHMMAINGRGNKGWKPLQQGLRERLFCEKCEQHFNEYFEKPFHAQWRIASPLPNPWTAPDLVWVKVNYSSFKLFHLSIIFRASVSSLPTYSAVDLGPHEDRLRTMLQNRDPGRFWQYPIMARVVVHHETNRIIDMVTWPERLIDRIGQSCYRMLYGGVEWTVIVGSHRNCNFEKVALQEDGCMPLCAVPWNEVSAIQEASRVLRMGNT